MPNLSGLHRVKCVTLFRLGSPSVTVGAKVGMGGLWSHNRRGRKMRAITLVMALCLSACTGSEQATEANMDETEATEAVATAFDGGSTIGTFEAVSTDGTVLKQTTSEDGTIVSVDAEGNSVPGTYTMGDGKFCITNEGDEDPSCFAYSDLKDDGSWTATNEADASDSWTVRRLTD